MKDGGFRTTRWSVVLSARAKDEPGSAEALASLCEAYWYPLYHFVRRRGYAHDDALDLTQGYFLRLMERDYLGDVRPELGKFRSFLLASLKHYMAKERRRAATLKRGGGSVTISLDAEAAENRYRLEPPDERTPEKAYERQWALTVVEQARRRLRDEMRAAGREKDYRLLAGYLSGDVPGSPYGEVAVELDTTEAAVKMAVLRLRRHFGRILREEIAQTVVSDAEVDGEVRHLLSVVREA